MKAYELLSDKSKWCQKNVAVDARGVGVSVNSPDVVRWCLDGALLRCYGWNYHPEYTPACYLAVYRQVVDALHCVVSAWNDAPGRTYAEVVGLLKRLDI